MIFSLWIFKHILPVNRFASAFLVPKHHIDFVVIGGTNIARELHLVPDHTVNGNNRYCNKEKDKLEINVPLFL